MNEQRNQRQQQMLLDFAKKNTAAKRKPRVSINPATRLPSLERLLEIDAEAEAAAAAERQANEGSWAAMSHKRRQAEISERDFQRFKETMQAAKAEERRRQAHGDAAKADRLPPAPDVTADWLGIGGGNVAQDAPGRARAGQRDSDIEPRPDASERILGDAGDGGGNHGSQQEQNR